MRRVAVIFISALCVSICGCLGEASYSMRLDRTLEDLREQQRQDTYLNPAEPGPFKEKQIFVRAPKGMARDPQPVLPVQQPGLFDLAESYSGTLTGDTRGAAGLPWRMHVLVRLKTPPKVAVQKGAPPPPQTPRRPFEQFEPDVRAILSTAYGVDVTTVQAQKVTVKGREYTRLTFKTPTDNIVRAHFYKGANHYVALIWDVPPGFANAPAVDQGINLSLGCMAVGNAALASFEGRREGEGATGGGGVAF